MFKSLKERKKLKKLEKQRVLDEYLSERISDSTKYIEAYESDLENVKNPLTKVLLTKKIQDSKEIREVFQYAKENSSY